MSNLFDTLKGYLSGFAGSVAKKTGETVDIQKLKAEKRALERENRKNYEEIGRFVFDRFANGQQIADTAADICETIRERMAEIEQINDDLALIKESGRETSDTLVSQAKGVASAAGEGAKQAYGTIKEKVVPTIEPIVEKAKDAAEPIANTAKEKAEPVIEKVKETTDPVVEKVKETAEPVIEKVKETAEPVIEKVKETAEPVVEKVKETAEPVVEKAKKVVPIKKKKKESSYQAVDKIRDRLAKMDKK